MVCFKPVLGQSLEWKRLEQITNLKVLVNAYIDHILRKLVPPFVFSHVYAGTLTNVLFWLT